jgi:pyruvate dehydrogenase E2 component (dihydrolipoamide acetyltransferase)
VSEPTREAPKRARDSDGWEALNPMERAMAARMAEAVVPMAAQFVDVRVDAALDQVRAMQAEGLPATFNAVVVHAVMAGLREHPAVAAEIDYAGKRRRLPDVPGIGIAVVSPRGLVVPAFSSTSTSLRDVVVELNELVESVRNGAASPDLFRGAHFTISNIGGLGIHGGFPTPNPPQPAILGVASARQVPIVVDGQIVVGTVSSFTLALDHRALDGITAARFLRRVADLVENPQTTEQ